MWFIDPMGCKDVYGKLAMNAVDSWLVPIRDQKGDDEMLRIAGKPKPEVKIHERTT